MTEATCVDEDGLIDVLSLPKPLSVRDLRFDDGFGCCRLDGSFEVDFDDLPLVTATCKHDLTRQPVRAHRFLMGSAP